MILSEGRLIDALTAADAMAASGLSAEFRWPHRPVDWALFLRVGRGVAWREGGVLLGTAMWFPLGPDHASIGGVQVAPALQGRGIGRLLMAAVMADAAPRALKLNATAEGAGLYAKFGFAPVEQVDQWQGVCRVGPGPGGAADPAVMARYDAAVGLARPGVMAAWLEGAAAVTRPGGYGVRRDFGHGQLIGPLVAADEAAALGLVQELAVPGFLRVDIPASALGLAGWLGEAGLAKVDETLLMRRGGWPDPAGARIWAPAASAVG